MKAFTVVFGLALIPGGLSAAPAVIGTVSASGAFRLNGDTVIANGTVTEGAMIETGSSNSAVRMTSGTRLFFSPDSRGKLFRDRYILEKGQTHFENGAEFHLEALGLKIRPEGGNSAAWIASVGNDRVRVAALTGSFRVLNERGGLVAKVPAGSALLFEPLAPSRAAATRLTGMLKERNGHYLLTDQVTQVTADITGPGLALHAGHVVQVTGMLKASVAPATGASQVIKATEVQTIAPVGSRSISAGSVRAVKSAVVGGVVAEATLGELAGSSLPAAVQAGPPTTPPGPPPGRPPVPPVEPPGPPPARPPVTPPPLSR